MEVLRLGEGEGEGADICMPAALPYIVDRRRSDESDFEVDVSS